MLFNKQTKKEEKQEEPKEKDWLESEGQLAVDVYHTEKDVVIVSAIAGLKPDEIEIITEKDLIVIKGKREKPKDEKSISYFYQECWWGPFSRSIIMPEETDPSRVQASMKDGILIIRIPKISREKRRKIEVK